MAFISEDLAANQTTVGDPACLLLERRNSKMLKFSKSERIK